jgi:hypothetical protein
MRYAQRPRKTRKPSNQNMLVVAASVGLML